MTDNPSIEQRTTQPVMSGQTDREGLIALLRGRDGADFDGEVHLTSAEAAQIIEALSNTPAQEAVALRSVVTDLLSLADSSNWPELKGAEFRGYEAAMGQVHQLASDYQTALTQAPAPDDAPRHPAPEMHWPYCSVHFEGPCDADCTPLAPAPDDWADCGSSDKWCVLVGGCERHGFKRPPAPVDMGVLREALEPFARLKVPKRIQGNAAFYSLLHADIRRAQAALTALKSGGGAE